MSLILTKQMQSLEAKEVKSWWGPKWQEFAENCRTSIAQEPINKVDDFLLASRLSSFRLTTLASHPFNIELGGKAFSPWLINFKEGVKPWILGEKSSITWPTTLIIKALEKEGDYNCGKSVDFVYYSGLNNFPFLALIAYFVNPIRSTIEAGSKTNTYIDGRVQSDTNQVNW